VSIAPQGSLCAIHPESPAQQICGRCGSFMCASCSNFGLEALCPTCRASNDVGDFPYARDNYTVSGLFSFAWERFQREWLMLSIAALIWVAGIGVGSMISGVFTQVISLIFTAAARSDTAKGVAFAASFVVGQGVGFLINTIVQGALSMGLFRLCFDVLEGRKADVARMFTQVSKLGRYVLMQLIIFAAVLLPLMAFLVAVAAVAVSGSHLSFDEPRDWLRVFDNTAAMGLFGAGMLAIIPLSFWFGLPLSLAPAELTYSEAGPWEALTRSWALASGHRFSIFGLMLLGGLVVLVGLLACCVGMVPALGLYQLMLAGLFLALRTGSGLPPPAKG
jgi:MFS family permease